MASKEMIIQELAERLGNETTVEQAEKAFKWLDETLDIMSRIDRLEAARFFREEVSVDIWQAMQKKIEENES